MDNISSNRPITIKIQNKVRYQVIDHTKRRKLLISSLMKWEKLKDRIPTSREIWKFCFLKIKRRRAIREKGIMMINSKVSKVFSVRSVKESMKFNQMNPNTSTKVNKYPKMTTLIDTSPSI